MDNHSKNGKRCRPDAGITMIETLMAAAILVIGSIGMLALIVGAIATNNRNKMDSTGTMLGEAVMEQISSTFGPINGPGTSNLVDCALNTWPINTTVSGSGTSGAPLSGANIDFTQAQLAGWSMNYVVSAPCSTTGTVQGTYDVRWHLEQIGTSQTYLITVGSRFQGHGEGNEFFSLPVTLRFLFGN